MKGRVSFTELFDHEAVTEIRPRTTFMGVMGTLGKFVAVSCVIGVAVSLVVMTAVMGGVAAARPVAAIWRAIPTDPGKVSISQRNTLYDVNGNPFAEVWAQDRISVRSLNNVSRFARQGLVDTEDRTFWTNGGVDIRGTGRALLSGSGGGSGITQQLVKNLQFYNMAGRNSVRREAVAHSLTRKIRELRMSLAYTKTHSKQDILLTYFNTVAFGGPNVYSIESASRYFFGVHAKDLDLAQSAVLVGSVQNPAMFNLDSEDPLSRDRYKTRQRMVLSRMVAQHHITQAQADAAAREPLHIMRKRSSSGNCSSSAYPAYCRHVMATLAQDPRLGDTSEQREAVLARGGLHIDTFLDTSLTDTVSHRLSSDFGIHNRVVTPVAIVQPGTGGVLATGVNRKWGVHANQGQTTFDVASMPAGTGSTFKMVVLAAALEAGWDESDLRFDSKCPLHPGPNYDAPSGGFTNSGGCGGFQSSVLNYQQATAHSSNTWFITLAMKVGMKRVIAMAQQLGLRVPHNFSTRSLSFVLGAVENTPVDMAAAYATFANQGVYCPATSIKSLRYADGGLPPVPEGYDPKAHLCHRVMSPHTASVILKALRANTVKGAVPGAFGTMAEIRGYDAFGKSGTNESYNYAWAQVARKYSLFIDIYDMTRLTRGVKDSVRYHGHISHKDMAPQAGSDILRDIVKGQRNVPLDLNNQSRAHQPAPINEKIFVTVPSLTGMRTAQAVHVAQSAGLDVKVSRTPLRGSSMPSGVVARQSLPAGRSLPAGSQSELVLTPAG